MLEEKEIAENLLRVAKVFLDDENKCLKEKRVKEIELSKIKYKTYLMYDGTYYKIGKSVDPEKRLKQLKTGNTKCKLVTYGQGVEEKYLHDYYFRNRVSGEWFNLTDAQVSNIKRLIEDGQSVSILPSKSKYGWRLSDEESIKIQRGIKKSLEFNKSYKIDFGKYNGVKIVDMVTVEMIQYCEWFVATTEKQALSKRQLRMNKKYKAFKWWVKIVNKVDKGTTNSI